ncbi:MAG TPA: hypothetical protein VHK70_09715 [Burkholderiaceae bacterium]|jgi:hypothetical protein|nr:hypothetical protein [Burkholderiaceae bacterium]
MKHSGPAMAATFDFPHRSRHFAVFPYHRCPDQAHSRLPALSATVLAARRRTVNSESQVFIEWIFSLTPYTGAKYRQAIIFGIGWQWKLSRFSSKATAASVNSNTSFPALAFGLTYVRFQFSVGSFRHCDQCDLGAL